MMSLLTPKLTKYIPHQPTPKQAAFLWLKCRDAFYGGSAGGGKSDALLMAGLQYVDVPGYSALILRDSFKNLTMPGALLDRADEWLQDTDAHWDGDAKTWRFPVGATLTFGYLDGPRDHLNYKSAEFQFIGVDEASDLRWKQILYMFSRLRRLEGSNVPTRFRLASNPGGISHNELKSRYINPNTREKGAVFIPAGLADNPYLDVKDYTMSLMNLDPVTREQLLKGDWDIRESGRFFQRGWFKILDEFPSGKIIRTVRFWDLAATDPDPDKEPAYTVGVRMSLTNLGEYIIDSVIRIRKSPRYVEQIIRQTAEIDGKHVFIYMEQEPGSAGVNTIDNYRRNVLSGFVFEGIRPSGSKIDRARPYASQADAGNVYLVNGHWTMDYLEEMELFPDGTFKDQVDASSGAFDILAIHRADVRATWV